MKIIDLLNKIANGEEVPKKIKINNIVYEYRGYMYCTEKANYQDIEDYLFGKWNFNILNDEVEIIEGNKKIEKITINENGTLGFPNGCWTARNMDKAFAIKLNEVIEELEKRYEKQDK